jgi:preprotein translocase subunit SecF
VPPQSQFAFREKPVKKIILVFGLISGAISSLLMTAAVLFGDRIGLGHSYVLGYTTIVLSLMLVFFGVRSYRDNVGKGQITFSRAFLIGIAITVISCLFYVAAWEIVYFNFMPDFMDKYADSMIQKIQASGKSPAEIQVQVEKINKMRVDYKKPLYNMAYTFIEPFPVGLVITLLTAAILRRKTPPQPAVAV